VDYEMVRSGLEQAIPFNRHVGLEIAEVGDGRVESGAFGVGEGVVGHDPLDAHAEAGEPGGGTGEEAGAGRAALVGQELGVGEAGGVVDRDMQVFPADPARPVAAAVAGDAVAEAGDLAELLAVEVEQLAGGGALVADRRRRRLEGAEASEAEAAQHAADGRARPAERPGDARSAPALAAQALDRGDDIGRRPAGERAGAELRSWRAGSPPSR